MATVPEWINRDSIQLTLIVLITALIHYFFISQRIQAGIDEEITKMEEEELQLPKQENNNIHMQH